MFLKDHPDVSGWHYKPFPLLDDLADLIDGGVATGDGAYQSGTVKNLPGYMDGSLNDPDPESRVSGSSDDELDNMQDSSFMTIDPSLEALSSQSHVHEDSSLSDLSDNDSEEEQVWQSNF